MLYLLAIISSKFVNDRIEFSRNNNSKISSNNVTALTSAFMHNVKFPTTNPGTALLPDCIIDITKVVNNLGIVLF